MGIRYFGAAKDDLPKIKINFVDGEIGNRQVMFGYAFILFSHVGSVDDKNSNEGSAEDGRDLVFASESFLSNNLFIHFKAFMNSREYRVA